MAGAGTSHFTHDHRLQPEAGTFTAAAAAAFNNASAIGAQHSRRSHELCPIGGAGPLKKSGDGRIRREKPRNDNLHAAIKVLDSLSRKRLYSRPQHGNRRVIVVT